MIALKGRYRTKIPIKGIESVKFNFRSGAPFRYRTKIPIKGIESIELLGFNIIVARTDTEQKSQ